MREQAPPLCFDTVHESETAQSLPYYESRPEQQSTNKLAQNDMLIWHTNSKLPPNSLTEEQLPGTWPSGPA
jgi:hypothetical protein